MTDPASEPAPAATCGDGTPENVVAIRGDNGIVVSWTAPAAVDGCSLTGFRVSVEWSEGGLTAVSQLSALPAETTVTVPDLGLADYEITVSAKYEERPRVAYHHVPATCTIHLTIVSDFDNGVTGSWTTSHDTCESSFRIQHRKPGRTAWDDSHSVPRAGVERAFLYGGLDPVQYEFRVQTTDEHGVIHNSNGATVMVLQDAAAGMAVGRPENVRVEIHPLESGLFVWWDDPLSIPSGKTVSGFYVEYQLATASPTSAWTRVVRNVGTLQVAPPRLDAQVVLIPSDRNFLGPLVVENAVLDDPNTPANEAAPAVLHGLAGLQKDTAYRVRVLTELTDTSDSTNKTTVASNYTDPVVVRHEPLSLWWQDNTPSYNPNIGRIFLTGASNHISTSSICNINGALIDCPPGTLVSLNVAGGGTYTISATGVMTSSTGSIGESTVVIPSDTAGKNAVAGSQVSQNYFASGSDDTMYVRWQKVGRAASLFESYLIQTRKSGGDWVTTVVDKNKADARHGLSNWIDYELSADELKNCHSGLDPAPLAVCQAESASGEYEVRIRIRTAVGTGASRREIDGPSTVALSRTVGGGRSGIVTDERTDHTGAGSLRVSWEPTEDAARQRVRIPRALAARRRPGGHVADARHLPAQVSPLLFIRELFEPSLGGLDRTAERPALHHHGGGVRCGWGGHQRASRRKARSARLTACRRGPRPAHNPGHEDKPVELVAEGVGFEPTIPGGIPVFKTGAIVHSAIPPGL